MTKFKILLSFVFFAAISLTNALIYNTNCGKTYDLSRITLADKFVFRTVGSFYGPNQNCKWMFKLGNICTSMKVNCINRFFIKGNYPKCTTDYLEFAYGARKKRFCWSTKPNFSTKDSPMTVTFKSDALGRGRGFHCFVQCISVPTPPPCACGKVRRLQKIVGGEVTEINEYKSQVGITSVGLSKPWCGGTLLNDRWVLTAHHCINRQVASRILLLLGEHDWSTSVETKTIKRKIEKIVSHPQTQGWKRFDLALLKMKNSINFGDPFMINVRPACLPDDDAPAGSSAIITGWGTLKYNGGQPKKLQEAKTFVISNLECNNLYNPNPPNLTINEDQLCAFNPDQKTSTCHGDSGGPLFVRANNSLNVQGVTSWGYGCANKWPGVYASVRAAISWIMTTTGGQAVCPKNDDLPFNEAG